MDRKQARLGMAGTLGWSWASAGITSRPGVVRYHHVRSVTDDDRKRTAAVRHADLDPAGVGGEASVGSQFR